MMARENGSSKDEAVRRAITGYANLRRIICKDEELILRKQDQPHTEKRGLIL